MISRVAESCFWLGRYIERVETVARVASVNRFTVLDADIIRADRWKPVIAGMGQAAHFEATLGAKAYNSDAKAEKYLAFDEANDVSIRTSLHWVRENARTTREVISREMWETINTFWQWYTSTAASKQFRSDRVLFYQTTREFCAQLHGTGTNTMLHEEPLDFLQLGTALERASQTVRCLGIKHYWRARSRTTNTESPEESAQWVAALRLCAAVEPFYKCNPSAPTGKRVTRFLLQHPTFPRSVRHGVRTCRESLQRIDRGAGRRGTSASLGMARELEGFLKSLSISSDEVTQRHEPLGARLGALGEQIGSDYFDHGPRP